MKRWIATGACLFASSAAAGPATEVSASCSTDVGGGRFGVTLRRGGEIVRWHASARYEDPEEFPMRSNPALTDPLLDEVDAMGFEQIEYQKTGDLTCSLVSGVGDSAHRVSWPLGDRNAPARVRQLASRIRALLDDSANLELQPTE